jgi:uncharacterized protein with GYD domain
MIFVTKLKSLPGQYMEAIKIFKHPKIPEGINIREFLGLFGDVDAIVVFDSPDEKTAAEFTVQFGHVAEVCTAVALPIEELKWTH